MGDGMLHTGLSGQFYVDPNGMKRESPTNWSPMPQMQQDGLKHIKVEEGAFAPMAPAQGASTGMFMQSGPTGFTPPPMTQQPSAAAQHQPPQEMNVGVPAQEGFSTVSTQPSLLQLPDAKQREQAVAQFKTSGERAARKVLNAIARDLQMYKEMIPQIHARQFDAIRMKNEEGLQALLAQESEMVGRFKVINDQIEELDREHILTPDELRMVSDLRQASYITCEQLNLYLLEAQQVISARGGQPTTCIASLVITSQPFPLVLSKGKLVDTSLDVALLTGTTQELKQTQHFMPVITSDPPAKSVAQNIVMVAKEEATNSTTTQLKLKMMNGSRMMPVLLKMSITVAYSGGSAMLESQCSRPFIVITNENQYEESNGGLLKYLAFGAKSDTPWTKFANELQRHFVQATKQDGSAPPQPYPSAAPVSAAVAAAALTPENLPIRALSVHDMEYIHNRFFAGRPVISVSQFDQFWAWFGKILQRMRSTRQVCGMWRDGLLWGFAQRNEIEQALLSQPVGSFVVRFSERHPGSFAIAYKNPSAEIRGPQSEPPTPMVGQMGGSNGIVKHYLVRPEEISTQKTLPDFLNDITGLSVMIRIVHNDFGTEIDPPAQLPEPLYIPIPKTEALEKFLSKREQVTLVGYEPNLTPMPMMM